jgi:RHS repeat-associated protein
MVSGRHTGVPESIQFTGQRLDAETDLLYLHSRYYDPQLGRFISPDSQIPDAHNPQSINRYSYVVNNPVNSADPTGHQPVQYCEVCPIPVKQSSDVAPTMVFPGLDVYLSKPPQAQTLQTQSRELNFTDEEGLTITATPKPSKPAEDSMTVGQAIEAGLLAEGPVTPSGKPVQSPVNYDLGLDMFGKFAHLADLQANGLAFYDMAATKALESVASRSVAEGSTGLSRSRWWQYGNTKGALGETSKFGDITVQPGLGGRTLSETVRHETVHKLLSPLLGPRSGLRLWRADLSMWGYNNSHLLRFTEEFLAETAATLNPAQGARFAFSNYSISAARLAAEGGGYLAVLGAGYGTGYYEYRMLNQPLRLDEP